MATGQDRQRDVVVDAEPDTELDQPVGASASNRSESESSDDDYFGTDDERETQRGGDLMNSHDQPITDAKVSEFRELLPYKLKEGVIHILIINADGDRKKAERFKASLEANVAISHPNHRIDLNVRLLHEVMAEATKQLDIAFKKSVFIFLFITNSFVKEKWPVLKGFSCLEESCQNGDWCVIPIHTAPKTSKKYQLPIGLKHLRGFNYWQGSERECYQDINVLLNKNYGSILQKERKLIEKIKRFCQKHQSKLQKNLEHLNYLKSFSSPFLNENVSRSTATRSSSEQNLPQYPQQMEPTPRNPLSQGLSPHPYSCPTNLCQESGENQLTISKHVAQSDSQQSEILHSQLPSPGVTTSYTTSNVAEVVGANRDSDISFDGGSSIDQPGGEMNSRTNAVNVNLGQVAITGDCSNTNTTPVGDDRAADTGSDYMYTEAIPNAAADEAEAEVSEAVNTSSTICPASIGINFRTTQPEQYNLDDSDEFLRISSLKL